MSAPNSPVSSSANKLIPSTPPRDLIASFSSSPPKTPTNQKVELSAAVLTTPDFQLLRTPAKSHNYSVYEDSPSQLSGPAKKAQKKLLSGLAGKGPHTLASPTRLKNDTDMIRKRKLQPECDSNGSERFVVTSPGSGKARAYKRHEKANSDGTNRLFPISLSPDRPNQDTRVVTLPKGQAVLDLRNQWKASPMSASFSDFVQSTLSAPRLLPPKSFSDDDEKDDLEASSASFSTDESIAAPLAKKTLTKKELDAEYEAFMAGLPAGFESFEDDEASLQVSAPAPLSPYAAQPSGGGANLWNGALPKLPSKQGDDPPVN